MHNVVRLSVAAAAAASLSACATVPALKSAHGLDSNGKIRVQNIVDHIACEIYRAIPDNPELVDQKYYIKILLNLQVDDQFDFTPSLTYLDPLPKMTSFAATVGGDFGLQRRRLFTTTYNIDAVQLKDDFDEKSANPECQRGKDGEFPPLADKLYDLQGDLAIEQIIDDGLKVVQKGDGILTNPSKAGDGNAPTFGSQVQFIITKQVTSLGPTWTLKYFKGPSGSNGLVSGKILDTDSLTITFSPQLVEKGLIEKIAKKRHEKTQHAIEAQAKAAENLEAASKNVVAQQHSLTVPSTAAIQAAIAEVTKRTAEKTAADKALADANALEQTPIPQRDETPNRAAAAAATSELQTSILLQGLSNVPR